MNGYDGNEPTGPVGCRAAPIADGSCEPEPQLRPKTRRVVALNPTCSAHAGPSRPV